MGRAKRTVCLSEKDKEGSVPGFASCPPGPGGSGSKAHLPLWGAPLEGHPEGLLEDAQRRGISKKVTVTFVSTPEVGYTQPSDCHLETGEILRIDPPNPTVRFQNPRVGF